MAFPTAVNDGITDAVTQSAVKVLGDAPAQAMGALYQAVAQAQALAAQDATEHQRNIATVGAAAASAAVAMLLQASAGGSRP